jgi:molybdopterin converting factor small subunit
LPAGATLCDLIAEVWARYPALKAMASPAGGSLASMIRWLVNSRIVAEGTPLASGDEITLLPGAGGG